MKLIIVKAQIREWSGRVFTRVKEPNSMWWQLLKQTKEDMF